MVWVCARRGVRRYDEARGCYVYDVSFSSKALVTGRTLGVAEAEVIYLAKHSGILALLDDEAARTIARALGLKVKGSIGMIIQAQKDGLIKREEALKGLERLSRVMYLNVDTYRLAMREMEQVPKRERQQRPRGN